MSENQPSVNRQTVLMLDYSQSRTSELGAHGGGLPQQPALWREDHRSRDPRVRVGGLVLTLVAGAVPARRITRMDPACALRTE